MHNFPRGKITQREAPYVNHSVTPREIELKVASEPERQTELRDGGRWERIRHERERARTSSECAPGRLELINGQRALAFAAACRGSVVVAGENPWRE